MKKRRRRQDILEEVAARLEAMESVALLRPIAEKIRPAVEFLVAAKKDGSADAEKIDECGRIHLLALKQLPDEEDVTHRFLFDAYLIQSFGGELRGCRLAIPSMVLPRYDQPWRYRRVPLGPAEAVDNPAVDVIGFRGPPSLEAIDLLEYAWLVHELGHSAFKANDVGFGELGSSILGDAFAKRRARAISLQGAALRRSRDVVEKMAEHWGPHDDRNSWALEIGVDLFALWLLGPAYGAAFLHVISSPQLNPFEIDIAHPPYAIRTRALEEATRRLGWEELAEHLAQQMSCWRGRKDGRSMVADMSDQELVTSLVYRTLDLLERCEVPRCTESDLADARSRFRGVDRIEFGRTLLLSAHVAHEILADDQFNEWHSRVVSTLAEQLTP